MDTPTEPRVRLEPAVTEDWIRRVVLAGHSPNDFASWILEEVNLDEMLARFSGEVGSGSSIARTVPDRRSLDDEEPPAEPRSPVTRAVGPRISPRRWTKDRFFEFLDLVASVEDMVGSSRLLGAYLRLGPIPSSKSLKELCGFADEGEWQTALRVAKQRLTVQARRLECPPLFRRAKAGREQGERLHPIEPLLFGWLREWGRERSGTAQPEEAFPAPERWGWEPPADGDTED